MNERIKELEERCWEELGEEECYYTVFNREKFAELLLNDVLAIVKNNTPNLGPYDDDYDMRVAGQHIGNFIHDEIKREYGVEE